MHRYRYIKIGSYALKWLAVFGPVVKIAAIDPTPNPGARQGKRLTESRARYCTRFAQSWRRPPRLMSNQLKQYHPELIIAFHRNPVSAWSIDLTAHGILPMHLIGRGWLPL